jgi:CheY-like chemotaxis protein
MTSMGTRGDAKYFAKLGFNAYFPKPATTSDLFDTLALTINDSELIAQAEPLITHHYLQGFEHSQDHEHISAIPSNKNQKDLSKCRLLLVEDNRINQEVAKHILAEFNINVDIAGDGIEALEALKMSHGYIPYDFILMDCQMPEMDGYQATQAIRSGQAGESYKSVAIIAMTANAMVGDKEKCLQAGMSDYLSKPIEPNSLLEKLLQWYDQEESRAAADIVEPPSTANNPEVNAYSENQDETASLLWDKAALLKRVSQKEQLAHKLLALFLDDMPAQMADFGQAYTQQDTADMVTIIHKMKGIAGNISALELCAQINVIEALLREDDMNQSAFDEFSQSYQNLQQLLTEELTAAV